MSYNKFEDVDTEESHETEKEANTEPEVPPSAFLDPHDIGPSTIYYRTVAKRPSVQDIRAKVANMVIQKEPPVDDKVKPLNSFTGVFLPNFVNLIAMTYWTRAGKLVGDCGIVFSIGIIWLASLISIILITSLSAMGTNGDFDNSGVHYLISRTIGPELGRCFTIFLDIATCLSAAMAIIGYAESIVSMYEPSYFTKSEINDIRVIAFIIMIVAVPLTRFIVYSIRVTAVSHMIGVTAFILGCLIRKTGSTEGFFKPNLSTFKSNVWSHDEMTLSKFMNHIYTVTPGFTALTGGFLTSGKLKRPSRQLPKGTWTALGVSLLIWHVTILFIGFCGDRNFLIEDDISPLMAFSLSKWICLATITVYGMHRSIASLTLEKVLIGYLASDNLIPAVKYHFDVWIPLSITAIFVGIGKLDFAANINTIFFLSLTVLINYCVFVAANSHIPGWRPKSKFWNKWVSLFGSLITLVFQFLISWISSLINWALFLAIYSISYFEGSTQNWGSVMQAQAWYKTYIHALGTQRINECPKLFRINLLSVVKEDEKFELHSLPLIKSLLHNDSFCIISQVMDQSKGLPLAIERRENLEQFYANNHHIFFETVLAKDARRALRQQMLLSGVGAFRPNTVFINIQERTADEIRDMVLDVLEADFNIILNIGEYGVKHDSKYVDVYWLADDGGMTLLSGYLIAKYLKKKLRVLTVAYTGNGDTVQDSEERLHKLCEAFRMDAEVIGIEINETDYTPSTVNINYWERLTMQHPYDPFYKRFILFADAVGKYSKDSARVVCTLLIPTKEMSSQHYLDILKLITHIQVSCALVRGNGKNILTWKA